MRLRAAALLACLVVAACAEAEGDDGKCRLWGEALARIDGVLTGTLAKEHYETDATWTTSAMITAAESSLDRDGKHSSDTDFFVDDETGERRVIKRIDDMSDDELVAYNGWINSGVVQNAIAGNHAVAMEAILPDLDRLKDHLCD